MYQIAFQSVPYVRCMSCVLQERMEWKQIYPMRSHFHTKHRKRQEELRSGPYFCLRRMKGLLLPNGILRHASSAQKQVVDVDFYEYTNQQKQNKNNIGITLVKIK